MNQLDHPIIILFQVATAIAMFKLFFSVRKAPTPLPQFVGLLAVSILVCASARIGKRDWFFIPDIVQYGVWFVSTVVSVLSAQQAKVESAKMPGAVVVVPDALDKLSNKIVWAIGLIAGVYVISDYVGAYNDKQKAEAAVTTTALNVYASATEHYAQAQEKTEAKLDTTLAAVTSISAAQGTIIANQKKTSAAVLASTQNLTKQVKQTKAEVKKTIQSSVINARPIQPKAPKTEEPKPEKENIWKRFKGLIHVRADTTAQLIIPDTLAFQQQ